MAPRFYFQVNEGTCMHGPFASEEICVQRASGVPCEIFKMVSYSFNKLTYVKLED